MESREIESLFFRPPPATALELAERRRESSEEYQSPPVRTANRPYRLALASVLPARAAALEAAGKLVFHCVGDTGGVSGRGAQDNVAHHMTRQVNTAALPDQPSFLFHLGDVVYFHGEDTKYHDQFYGPFQDYPAPIFAVPGNHDGMVGGDSVHSLDAFMKHFCSRVAYHAAESGHSNRPTMTQPNPYWRLDAPLVTILGLYSNVSGELDNTDARGTAQRDWLAGEMAAAPADKALLIAVHHPPYSLGGHASTIRVGAAIDYAFGHSGRFPHAVLSGHSHNYQRFTRELSGRQIPYLVVGAGGMAGYDLARVDAALPPGPGVKLEHYNHRLPGFIRVTVTADRLKAEYFAVPGAGHEGDLEASDDAFEVDLRAGRLV
jgi:hypothetical protein